MAELVQKVEKLSWSFSTHFSAKIAGFDAFLTISTAFPTMMEVTDGGYLLPKASSTTELHFESSGKGGVM